MKNVHVLPTENSSRLHKVLQSTFILKEEPAFAGKLFKSTPQYIYITSEEKVIEGDWFINGNYIDKKAPKFSQRYAMNSNYVFSHPKKIILTTDVDLISDGVQAIDDEFLQWFVKNPKCEEIGVKSEEIVVGSYDAKGLKKIYDDVYKIIIPIEETKQETIESQPKAVKGSGSLLQSLHQDLKGFQDMGFLTPDAKSGLGIAIEQVERYMRGDLEARAAWQEQKMYSEEDMKKCWKASFTDAMAIDEETYKPLFFGDFIERLKKT